MRRPMITKSPSNPRVLIAEDDPALRDSLAALVETEGYAAVVVDDGRDAYRRLLADADFSMVILDMLMPYLKGLDILRYMRTEKRLMKIPVVMITGDCDLSLMADSFAAGAVAFLTKPFKPEQLQNTLRLFLSRNN